MIVVSDGAILCDVHLTMVCDYVTQGFEYSDEVHVGVVHNFAVVHTIHVNKSAVFFQAF